MATTAEAAPRAGKRPPWNRRVRLTALYHEHAARGADFVESDGWLLPRSYGDAAAERAALQEGVGLLDISESGKIDLKSTELTATLSSAFPDLAAPPVGAVATTRDIRILGLTAEQALLVTTPAALEGTLTLLAQRDRAHVTDLTGALCGVRLLGPQAPAVLERLCSLDLAPDRFAAGAVAQGGLAKIHALITRRDSAAVTGYDLYVERDLGAYLWQALLEAGAPLGITPVGRDAEEAR